MSSPLDPPTFRRGVRLGIDWGKARVGVAACDADGLLCYPVETVPNSPQTLRRLEQIVAEYEPFELILGWPMNLKGEAGPAVEYMSEIAHQLMTTFDLPVRLVDERMTTASASRQLAQAGRSSKQRRGVIDQAAAVAILESAVQAEKTSGVAAGNLASDVLQPTKE